MPLLALPFEYLWWHYTLAWRDLVVIWGNYLWFIYHFFSISVLARTLLAPWKRLGEVYPARFNLGATLATFFINSLMRLVGAVIRIIMLVFGGLVYLLVILLGSVTLILWLVLPLIIILALVLGLALLFK
ncbi:MAG: hypothetical protein AAB364_00370 [Patescibacteria group bacterium]